MEDDTSLILPKKITLLTGFLGAGKTTFLNAWLHYFREKRLLVVENEFGEINVDAQLIATASENIFSLSGGCICCGSNEAFVELLSDLWRKKDLFDEIVVEATGVADPSQLLSAFKTSQSMKRFYEVERTICLVDSTLIVSEIEHTDIARQQIIGSDILILSKTDLISHAALEEIIEMLQTVNPWAEIVCGNKFEGFPIENIIAASGKNSSSWPKEIPHSDKKEKGKIRLSRKTILDISTLHFSFDEPYDLDELKYRLLVFLNFQSANVYRIKGILSIEGSPQKMLLQTVGDIVAFEPLGNWHPTEKKQSTLVIIGKNLRSYGFEKMFRNCLYEHHSDNKNIL